MDHATPIIAADVSKARLDAFDAASGEHFSLPNTAQGHAALCRRAKAASALVALKASGGHERATLAALAAAGIPARLCDPRKVRHFARAHGQWAKTDRLDARIIAAFAQAIPGQHHTPDPDAQRLAELVAYRRQLIAADVALANQAAHFTDAELRRDATARRNALSLRLARTDRRIADLIAQTPRFAARAAILRSIPGIGPVMCAVLLAELPELGSLDRREAAALAGVAPMDNSSGQRHGRKGIYAGRTALRTTLYMAALVAGQKNPALAAFRQRLRNAGKQPKVAIVAVMRKLVVLANALVRNNTPFQHT